MQTKINSSNKITLIHHENGFTEVIRRPSNNFQRCTMNGTATSIPSESAKFHSHIHLYDLDVTTPCEEITKNLEKRNILEAKHSDLHSSLKVSVPSILHLIPKLGKQE